MADAPSRKAVFNALGSIIDPGDAEQRDIVETDLVASLEFDGSVVNVGLQMKDRSEEEQAGLVSSVRETLMAVAGVTGVQVDLRHDPAGHGHDHDHHGHDHGHDHDHDHDHGHGHGHDHGHDHAHGDPHVQRPPARQTAGVGTPQPIPGVERIIAVASGKGGVGKSTTAVNLALALVHRGHSVGLLDCDVYGPSLPLLVGVEERPSGTTDGRIAPIDALGLKLMSIGFFSGDNQPMMWRGPIVLGVVTQFLQEVDWGKLDYLIVDLPPGTGDAPLTLIQRAPITGAVIVTTPSDVALADATKGLNMFKRVNVPVLGLVENMTSFTCDGCGHVERIFGESIGEKAAAELGVPFLGGIPLDPAVRKGGDESRPVVALDPDGDSARPFMALADALVASVEGNGNPAGSGDKKKRGLFSMFGD